MKRREVLQTFGTLGAGIVAFSTHDQLEALRLATARSPLSNVDLAWHKAPCRYCGTGCGVEVGLQDGKVMAVRGDQASPVNRGLLCVKGYHLPALLYGADRLRYPLQRRADGSGWERLSWDQAIALIATKFSETLAQHGPEAVAMYGSGQWTAFDGYAALKWVKGGMRSNNLEANARLCMASAVMGFMTQFQNHPPAEVPDAEYPFWLTTGRVLEHWHTGSMTRRTQQLYQAVPHAYVELNRADALELGVKKDDWVRLHSRRGSIDLPVEVDGRGKPPRRTVFVPFFDESRLVNLLTLDAMDSISKEPDYKKCAVRIERL